MKNAKLAYEVMDHITANPEEWRQSDWFCGTRMCFAGHVVNRSGYRFCSVPHVYHVDGSKYDRRHVGTVADELLGISGEEGSMLYYGSNSLERLWELVEEIFGPRPGTEDVE